MALQGIATPSPLRSCDSGDFGALMAPCSASRTPGALLSFSGGACVLDFTSGGFPVALTAAATSS